MRFEPNNLISVVQGSIFIKCGCADSEIGCSRLSDRAARAYYLIVDNSYIMFLTILQPTLVTHMLSFDGVITSGCHSAETYRGASPRINFLVNIDFHRIFPFLYLT